MKALLFLFTLSLCGCVLQSKYDASQKASQKQIDDLNNKLKESNFLLAETKVKLDACGAHKYQFMLIGNRTFRFDTVTGASCIQLTSDSDWKMKKTKSQSCDCIDLFVDFVKPDETMRKLYCGW